MSHPWVYKPGHMLSNLFFTDNKKQRLDTENFNILNKVTIYKLLNKKMPILTSSTTFPWTKPFKRQIAAAGGIISRCDGLDLCNLTSTSQELLIEKIRSLSDEDDPSVVPSFAMPGAVTHQVQLEVLNIIASYQLLAAADFAGGALPVIAQALAIPPALIWNYHHAQMAVVGVVERLSNPGHGPNTATINNLPIGAFICDLTLFYANVAFVLHICRR